MDFISRRFGEPEYEEYRATKDNPFQVACGGVVYRKGKDYKIEVLLLHRFKSKKWQFDSWHLPKGTQRVGEREVECAKREILEETGYEVEIGKKIGEWKSTDDWEGFPFEKTTHYFICPVLRKAAYPDKEHDEVRWVEISEGIKLLSEFPLMEKEEEVLERFQELYNRENA